MAQPNQLDPNVDRISFRNSTAVVTGGLAVGDTDIKTDVGTLAPGSIYISSYDSGAVWVMVSTTWTPLTIN